MKLDWEQLQRMSKTSSSFREYAQRWRQTTFQVQPALTKKENGNIFMSILSSTYYDGVIGHASASFTNLVQIRERIKDILKIKKDKGLPSALQLVVKWTGSSTKKNSSN